MHLLSRITGRKRQPFGSGTDLPFLLRVSIWRPSEKYTIQFGPMSPQSRSFDPD